MSLLGLGTIAHELPIDHNVNRTNWMIGNPGGLTTGHATPTPTWWKIQPLSSFNPIGHSPIRGPNSPSQLTHTFGK